MIGSVLCTVATRSDRHARPRGLLQLSGVILDYMWRGRRWGAERSRQTFPVAARHGCDWLAGWLAGDFPSCELRAEVHFAVHLFTVALQARLSACRDSFCTSLPGPIQLRFLTRQFALARHHQHATSDSVKLRVPTDGPLSDHPSSNINHTQR